MSCLFSSIKTIQLLFLLVFGIFSTSSAEDFVFGADGENAVCIQLRDNFRFDIAFNEHIRRSRRDSFFHYIVSDRKFFQVTIRSDHFQRRPSTANDQSSALDIQLIEVAGGSQFAALDYDLAFSLLAPKDNNERTQFCTLKLNTFDMTCVEMRHWNQRNFGHPEAYGPNTTSKFRLAFDFLPSVAFQPLEFADYLNSQYVVVFLEQRLVQNSTGGWRYDRRYQSYNLKNFNNIVNLTNIIELPSYLRRLPEELEITGIYSWKKSNKNEHMILAFNGTNHLYCVNENCAVSSKYVPYLEHCKPRTGRMTRDGRPLQMIDPFNKLIKEPQREELSAELDDESEVEKIQEARKIISLVWKLLVYMSCGMILILLVSILYFFVKETFINQQRMEDLEQARRTAKSSLETLTSQASSSPLLMNKVIADKQHPL